VPGVLNESGTIAAPATAVFDLIAAPYLGKTPGMAGHLRGTDMVLAEHYTRSTAAG
jgi:hypothetical protein